jgi:hypothetical protein
MDVNAKDAGGWTGAALGRQALVASFAINNDNI